MSALTTPIKYTAVRVLLICWADSGQPEFEEQLNGLGREFREYGFEVDEVYKIRSIQPYRNLAARLQEYLRNDSSGTLLIIYYGGHGLNDEDQNNIWLRDDPAIVTKAENNPKVNWSSLQSLFLDECESQVLFLLDCCFAASAVQFTNGLSTVEAIVAVGFDKVAPLQGRDSFTKFLTDVLKYNRVNNIGAYASRLCALVAAALNQTRPRVGGKGSDRRVTPHHLVYSNRPSTIYICPLDETEASNDAADRAENEAIPSILERSSTFAGDAQASRGSMVSPTVDTPTTPQISWPPGTRPAQQLTSNLGPPVAIRPHERQHRSRSRSSSGLSSVSDYPCLEIGADNIRLAHIHRSPNARDPISCFFSVQEVSGGPLKYTAISHTWSPEGDPITWPHVKIFDNNRPYALRITHNLDRCLRRLRRADDDIVVWVDQICIDQDSDDDRREQVALMPAVFQLAHQVVAWLGESDDSSDKAMAFIPQLVQLDEFDELIRSDETPMQWQALVRLMENKYFTRRWVFLEVILATRATIWCGGKNISWDEFCDAILLLGSRFEDIQYLCMRHAIANQLRHNLQNLADLRALAAYSVVEASRNLFRDPKAVRSQLPVATTAGQLNRTNSLTQTILAHRASLQTLVAMLPGLQSYNLHDVIYALLPISSDVAETGLQVNYTISLNYVFQQFVRYCAMSRLTIDIIVTPWAPNERAIERYEREVRMATCSEVQRVPSWICTTDNLPFGKRQKGIYGRRNGDNLVGHPDKPYYNAARGSSAVPIFGHTDENGQIVLDGSMIVSGFQIGQIHRLANRAAAGTLHEEWIKMGRWKRSDSTIADKFWRTLVADRGPGGTATPAWYHRACLYWLDFYEGEDVSFNVLQNRDHPSSAVQYMQRVQSVIWNRKLFTLRDRAGRELLGLAPSTAEEKDVVAILHGCSVPVVVRRGTNTAPDVPLDQADPSEPGIWWSLLGECFVYGVMEGEAMQVKEYVDATEEFLLR